MPLGAGHGSLTITMNVDAEISVLYTVKVCFFFSEFVMNVKNGIPNLRIHFSFTSELLVNNTYNLPCLTSTLSMHLNLINSCWKHSLPFLTNSVFSVFIFGQRFSTFL